MQSQKPLHQALEYKLFTTLKDRVLFFDGDTVITPDKVYEYAEQEADPRGGNLCVTESNEEITSFNALVDTVSQIREKTDFKELDLGWNIPEEYLNLNVSEYVYGEFSKVVDTLSLEDIETRITRIKQELRAYQELNLLQVLRVIIYVINTLRSYKVVWGIGRGSCVASYVLYLIGVHDVDSVLYELDYTDFLRSPD